MTIRAVTFDVGGTLIAPWPSVGSVYARAAARHGVGECDPAVLEAKFLAAWAARTEFDYSKAAWRELVRQTFSGLAEVTDPFFRDVYDGFAEPEVWRVFDDVLPVLEALKALGIPVGIVSNWDERLRPLLSRLDLARWFDPVVISCETGARKPHSAIFGAARDALGVDSGSILHVGDSAGEDVRGALAAGFRACRIRRHAPAAGPEDIPDLREILPLLESRKNPPR